MSESEFLHETKNYKVVVGLSPFGHSDSTASSQYLIVNKETGVVEAEHRVKAYALAWSEQFEELLAAFYENKAKPEVPQEFLPNFDGIPTPPDSPV